MDKTVYYLRFARFSVCSFNAFQACAIAAEVVVAVALRARTNAEICRFIEYG